MGPTTVESERACAWLNLRRLNQVTLFALRGSSFEVRLQRVESGEK